MAKCVADERRKYASDYIEMPCMILEEQVERASNNLSMYTPDAYNICRTKPTRLVHSHLQPYKVRASKVLPGQ